MIALARHVRPDGQPRRVWTPAPADSPSEPLPSALPSAVLTDVQTLTLRDRIAKAQWDTFVDKYGVIAAYERTTPGYWRRKVRRFVRRAVRLVANTTFAIAAVVAAAGLAGPFAYELGWF